MAVSDVAIANLALSRVGDARIASFEDNTVEARAIKAVYELTRDSEIYRHRWNFSARRESLAALSTTPVFGYAYAYQLPADCLRIHYVGEYYPGLSLSNLNASPRLDYRIEGRKILTDQAAPIMLLYGARITDPTQFDQAFVDALAYRLAMDVCQELTGSASKGEALKASYREAISEARRLDAIQDPPEAIADDTWLLARL